MATSASEIQYTEKVDCSELKLLCISLSTVDEVNWESPNVTSDLQNPFTIISTLNSGENILECLTNDVLIFSYTIFIQGDTKFEYLSQTNLILFKIISFFQDLQY